MSQPRAMGYAEFLLHDIRRDDQGALRPDFILNNHPTATVLLSGRNFGSGSSREAAVYALVDSGIRVVIAQGFGDIFAANAINNGLLPATVTEHHWHVLQKLVGDLSRECSVDLEAATINIGAENIPFDIDDTWRLKLINGWDDTDITLQHQENIERFRKARFQHAAWAWPTVVSVNCERF